MEPDEIQKIYQTYATRTPDDFYKVVSWSDNSGVRHNSYILPNGQLDLSSVSTRDLLNECYRRRAIEKFSFTDNIDQDYMMHNPDAKKYITHDLMKCLWTSICDNQKFLQDALTIKEETDLSYRTIRLTGEMYVCKHPTKVRK